MYWEQLFIKDVVALADRHEYCHVHLTLTHRRATREFEVHLQAGCQLAG